MSSKKSSIVADRVEYRIRAGASLVVAVEASLQPGRRVATGDRVGLEFIEQGHSSASRGGRGHGHRQRWSGIPIA